jgi:hypothetical protein
LYFTTLGYIDESCLGACDGEVAIDISGGTGSYIGVSTENTTGVVITSLMSNDSVVPAICSGDYTITITDANNCPSSMINGGVNQQTIGTNEFTEANINQTSIVNVLCNGAATGALEVLNPNLNTGYTYSWQNVNNPGITVGTALMATTLIAGDYVLYAEYMNYSGCTTTDTVTITEISAINTLASITNVDCYGNATGSVTVGQITGGTNPYNLLWTPGGQNTNLIAGTYTLAVTDANACQQLDTFEITQPQALSVTITQNGYVLTANTPNGGTPGFSYSWREQSDPSLEIGTGLTYTVDDFGVYYVQITDANGCIVISNSFEYTTTSLDDLPTITKINIYPNPFKDETTVDFGRVVKEVKIKILDILGKCLNEYTLNEVDEFIISRESKVNGIYFMKIEIIGQKTSIVKLIIE